MADLTLIVSNDISNSEINVVVFDYESEKSLFLKSAYHGNFFNGESTRRKRKSLAGDAAAWAEASGELAFADEIKNEYGIE